MTIAEMMTGARRASGAPFRALAVDAGVATSTITRIESGSIDPTWSTLRRLLGACGYELTVGRATSERRPRLAELVGAWSTADGDDAPALEWPRWRALLDELALRPECVPEAIYVPLPPSGHPTIDALLAGIAEKLADDAGLSRPGWAEATPAVIGAPFAPPARRRGAIPVQLAARGILIDETSLFRHPDTVGT